MMSKRILVEPTTNLFERNYISREGLYPWRATCLDNGVSASDVSSGAVLESLLTALREETTPTRSHLTVEAEARFERADTASLTEEYEVRVLEFTP